MASAKDPGLYEFLTEAELQDYFNLMKTDLKVSILYLIDRNNFLINIIINFIMTKI